MISPAKAPCKTCPYRKDVPSGVWAANEYAKLPEYDAPTWAQPPGIFLCHQRDGCLCAGWLGCHLKNPRGHELLSMRFDNNVDPAAFNYVSPVPLFKSGAAAAKHGMRAINRPSARAKRAVARLTKKLLRESKKS